MHPWKVYPQDEPSLKILCLKILLKINDKHLIQMVSRNRRKPLESDNA